MLFKTFYFFTETNAPVFNTVLSEKNRLSKLQPDNVSPRRFDAVT